VHRLLELLIEELQDEENQLPAKRRHACKIEGLDAMAYHHLTENDANQAMKFSNF